MTRLLMLDASTSEHHRTIWEDFRGGYYFKAYDGAMEALKIYPDDIGLKHTAVLSLLRGGTVTGAEELFNSFELTAETHEDILALSGRLVKGQIEEIGPSASLDLYTKAARLYEKTYTLTRGGYSGINAASLWFMAGDKARAEKLATAILNDDIGTEGDNEPSAYYRYATRAECFYILGDSAAAGAALKCALQAEPDNYGARASTIKQFKMLGGGVVPDIAVPLIVPFSLHYTGHLFHMDKARPERSLTEAETQKLSNDMRTMIDRKPIGSAFGALAAGSDILWAENLLDVGADLHLVLPVPVEDFKRLSVTPVGEYWGPRFDSVLARAKSLRIILDDPGDFDALDLKMGSLIAMGLTRLTAQNLSTQSLQYSVMDKHSADVTLAGTRQDIQLWHDVGEVTENIDWPHPRQEKPRITLPQSDRRSFRAMLFTDLKGYGGLPDRALPNIVSNILDPMAKKCRALNEPPLQMKSWGDGLFLVFENAVAAAIAAFDIMEEFKQSVARIIGSEGGDLSLRVGVHFGPVWERVDPFTETPNLYGRHVTTAARLEALALPGSICVSENFAALMAMSTDDVAHEFRCDYLGRAKSEKEDTDFSLYSLRKTRL